MTCLLLTLFGFFRPQAVQGFGGGAGKEIVPPEETEDEAPDEDEDEAPVMRM